MKIFPGKICRHWADAVPAGGHNCNKFGEEREDYA